MAIARVLLAILLLVDLSQRWSNLSAHYGDFGVLPRLVLLPTLWSPAWFSFATLSGHLLGLYAFFLFFLASVLSFGLGYQTRWSTLAVWVALVSIQNRNPLILDSADVYLRLVLFWMLFLPLGARWSLDARLGVKPIHGVSSLAYLGLALQTCLLLGQSGMGVSSSGGAAFFAVAACAVVALLPKWCWDVPLASLTRRWAQPMRLKEGGSLAIGAHEIGFQRVYKVVFGLFALGVLATQLVSMVRAAKNSESAWDSSMMFLRLDVPRPNQADLAPLTSESGRFVMEGLLRDGTVLERADAVESSFDLSDRRWRNYLTALRASGSEPLLDAYGEFLCRKRWSSPRSLHGLTDVKVSFIPRSVAPPEGQEELLLEYRMKKSRK